MITRTRLLAALTTEIAPLLAPAGPASAATGQPCSGVITVAGQRWPSDSTAK
jgi:hypothetical protein